MISKKEFDVLVYLTEHHEGQSQRSIAAGVKMSVGTVNKLLLSLSVLGFTDENKITSKGYDELENFRVKRAVFIAAGFGSRLAPITFNTPKPLIRVKGKRIIDSLLDAVVAAGIEEIYIVRGYLGEQFDQLLYKYPTIKFIENPVYNEANNISSAYCARFLLQNTYVLEADLLLYNQKLITKYQYSTNYLGVSVEETDDWCFYAENGKIARLEVGGRDCYHMFGISYLTEKDGAKISNDIKEIYQAPGGKERYWDQVALQYRAENYIFNIRECEFSDIIEIDTFSELKKLDETYDM